MIIIISAAVAAFAALALALAFAGCLSTSPARDLWYWQRRGRYPDDAFAPRGA